MAFFTTNQNLFSVVLLIFTTSFLLLETELVNSQKTVSFNISNFTTSQSDVSLQGSSVILPDGIVTITNPNDPTYLAGRILHYTPVPIWDNITANVASFITTFTFKVVDFKDFSPDGTFSTIAQVIDLKEVLPHTVRIGFSAATTTGARQLHHLHAWSFKSNLDTTTTTTSDNIASF
ncbi:putative concanavalin A-like lectin/glucanase domain-containing protein [Medicago truncatula]|uniref:Putative concanavalin A-like lectin/glucanase domain-containing protein n=1 Tax=Medicago truncatula TaxID=3880 RepID=A0A396JWZ7_MEDTR|nr:putative concanavalin A-like lectin/glucanase domain-containing protein [Medicago truncatula]